MALSSMPAITIRLIIVMATSNIAARTVRTSLLIILISSVILRCCFFVYCTYLLIERQGCTVVVSVQNVEVSASRN